MCLQVSVSTLRGGYKLGEVWERIRATEIQLQKVLLDSVEAQYKISLYLVKALKDLEEIREDLKRESKSHLMEDET